MRKLKRKIKQWFKVGVILLVAVTCLAGNLHPIEAVSYTGPFTRVKELDYPKWWASQLGVRQWSTWMCTFNGQWSYCLESSKNSPAGGEKTAQELIDSNEMVSKLLYYGFGGPAAIPGQLDGSGEGLSGDGLNGAETHYLYTHILLSIAYCGDMMGVDLDGLETLGIGLKGLYNYIASLPAPVNPNISDQLIASYDSTNRCQKTNTVTFNASENAIINVTLQDGVTLHNTTTNTSATGVVSVKGGQSFYLTAPMQLTGDYQSGNIAGENCNRFVPLAIYGNGNVQTHGSYAYDKADVNYQVKWLDSGNLQLHKTNANHDLIDGSLFNLKSISYDGYDEDIIVTNGKITVSNLPLGTYQLQEVKAPEGYLINNDKYQVEIKANQTTTTSVINNEPGGKINLTKQIDTSKTDGKSGEANLKGNIYGLYALENITNQAKTITYYQKDELIAKETTDQNGQLSFDNLYLGKYYLKELKSNDSLVLNQEPIEVSLQYDNQTVSKVTTNATTKDRVNMQKIQVHKSGEKEGISGFVKGLQGCQFTFKLKSEVDHVGWDQATTYDVITTDKDGRATTKYLPYGIYLVKETKTPKDYLTAPDFTIEISDDYSEYQDIDQIKIVDINNRPYTTQLRLIKRDSETKEIVTLNSATFKIKANEDIIVSGKTVYHQGDTIIQKVSGKNYDTFTTNSKNIVVNSGYLNLDNDLGSVVLPLQLDPGSYYIEEISTPKGFLALKQPVVFNVENIRDYSQDDDGDPILEVSLYNQQPKGEFELNKTVVLKDEITSLVDTSDLSTIKYQLTAKNDIVSPIDGHIIYKKGTIVKTYNLSKDGYLKVTDLPMGEYQIAEIATLPGLVLDQTKYDVVFKQSDTKKEIYQVKLELENKPTDYKFTKKDIGGNVVTGASLTVIDEQGNIIDKWISGKQPHEILGLEVGKTYRLHEDLSPLGYNLAKDIEFTVINDSKVQTINMTNTLTKVIKVNEENELLSGAMLQIVCQDDGKVIDQWVSGQQLIDINATMKEQLLNKETVTGQLEVDDNVVDYEIIPNSSQEAYILKMIDDKVTSYDYIDINGNETYHLATGLQESKTYILKEVAAPLGYASCNEQVFTLDNQDVTLVIENQITKVAVSKLDLTNHQELPGATLIVKDQAGNIIDQWISGDQPHMIKGLQVNQTYILQEIIAPEGYGIASDVSFTIQDTGEIQKVVMYDQMIVKTGDGNMIYQMAFLMGISGLLIMGYGLYCYRKNH